MTGSNYKEHASIMAAFDARHKELEQQRAETIERRERRLSEIKQEKTQLKTAITKELERIDAETARLDQELQVIY